MNIRLKTESNSCVSSRVAECPTVAERESAVDRERERAGARVAGDSLRGEPSYALAARGEFSRQAAAAANGRAL